jgi:ferrous iron transport protein A
VSARYNQDVINLLNVPNGKRARLVSISERLNSKLMQYGLYVGDFVRVLRSAPLGGPLLVEVNGREIALGRTVAEKIFVEVE